VLPHPAVRGAARRWLHLLIRDTAGSGAPRAVTRRCRCARSVVVVAVVEGETAKCAAIWSSRLHTRAAANEARISRYNALVRELDALHAVARFRRYRLAPRELAHRDPRARAQPARDPHPDAVPPAALERLAHSPPAPLVQGTQNPRAPRMEKGVPARRSLLQPAERATATKRWLPFGAGGCLGRLVVWWLPWAPGGCLGRLVVGGGCLGRRWLPWAPGGCWCRWWWWVVVVVVVVCGPCTHTPRRGL
jgi:hypothetical protein